MYKYVEISNCVNELRICNDINHLEKVFSLEIHKSSNIIIPYTIFTSRELLTQYVCF